MLEAPAGAAIGIDRHAAAAAADDDDDDDDAHARAESGPQNRVRSASVMTCKDVKWM